MYCPTIPWEPRLSDAICQSLQVTRVSSSFQYFSLNCHNSIIFFKFHSGMYFKQMEGGDSKMKGIDIKKN